MTLFLCIKLSDIFIRIYLTIVAKGLKNILLHVSDKGPNLPVHLLVGNPMASMSSRCLFLAHC